METREITQESLGIVFREIAQKRRQGTLFMIRGGETLTLSCNAGRIVEVVKNDRMPTEEVLERLIDGGFPIDPQVLPPAAFESYGSLFDAITGVHRGEGTDALTEEVMERAVHHRMRDILLELVRPAVGAVRFESQMITIEPRFEHSMTTGQLLLELVTYEELLPRIATVDLSRCVALQDGWEGAPLTDDETVLISVLQVARKGNRTVEHLRVRSLLSSLSFFEALLGLLDRGYCELVSDEGTPGSCSAIDTEGAAAHSLVLRGEEAAGSTVEGESIETSTDEGARSGQGVSFGEALLSRANSWCTSNPSHLDFYLLVIAFGALVIPFITWRRLFILFG